jgi:ABC-type multidrug transport system fused ATPase/permease subunit
MNEALRLARLGWTAMSAKGRKVLFLFSFYLVLLSGLDALALGTMSHLLTNRSTQQSDIHLSKPLLVVVILFIAKSLLATVGSWFAIRQFASEEVSLGQDNLEKIMKNSDGRILHLTEDDFYFAVDRAPNALVQGILLTAAGLLAEILTVVVILIVLVIEQPISSICSAIFFAIIVWAQHKFLSVRTTRASNFARDSTTSTYMLLNDAFFLRRLLFIMPSESLNGVLAKKRSLLADSRARLTFFTGVPRYFMEAVFALAILMVAMISYANGGEKQVLTAVSLFSIAGFRVLPCINRVQQGVLGILGHVPIASPALIPLTQNREQDSGKLRNEHQENPKVLLTFSEITFSYEGQDRNILDGVSFALEDGKTYAFVGPSGSGKTTLINLLMGILLPTSGSIHVLEDLENSIGYVSQETYISSSSFAGNIALEWENEAIRYPEQIKSLVHGLLPTLETFLLTDSTNELGRKVLSGGEQQRIGLARALYRKPKLLILDEATSALDNETEREVMDLVKSNKTYETLIIIAHRLSTIQNVDKIFYLENGRIIGEGDFKSLMNSCDAFRSQVELGLITY